MERPMNSMHPEVSKSLSDQPLRLFIDGEWIQAASGETAETTSPATGETIGEIPQGDRADAQRAGIIAVALISSRGG